MANTIRQGYGAAKLDLVITEGFEAFQFAVQYRDKMFPGVPIVFVGVTPDDLRERQTWPGVTGVTNTVGLAPTIDLALHLQPDTTAVAVITGVSEWEKHWLAAAHSELLRHQDKVREIDLVGSNGQLLKSVAALPPHTVALFQLAPQDKTQPVISTWDVLTSTAQHLPTYSPWQTLSFPYGAVGGAYIDALKGLVLTGETAARVLSGERPENIPVVNNGNFRDEVDWRALRRWHIPVSALPPGSVIRYRQPTVWERDRKYFIPAIVLIVAQGLLITGLLWLRARKRKAEAVLRESEKRFRVLADTTPSLIWMCDPRGKVTYLNDKRLAFTGPDPKAGHGDRWATYVHPDDLESVLDTFSRALKEREPFSKQYRLRRRDGVYRWMFDVASPRMNGDGSFAGFIGSAIDITDQKLAQEALEKVSGQLIEAQEKERSRIARELHDDICQRLALLSMELEQAKRISNASGEATRQRLQEIRQHCSELAIDVESLSHQLHSSKLDYLGIVVAVRGFCQEFAKQHEVGVDFRADEVPEHLPKQISLCLFRVAQEALQNALKYSGTSQFAVELRATPEEIQLVVRDEGAGFDVDEAQRNRGLGLVSMQERVHLVHGRFSVESKPGAGTTILAAVPLAAESGSTVDAGSEQTAV